MRGQQYRLKTPTLVIVKDGLKTSITIPHGIEVKLFGQLDGDRLLDGLWKRKTMMIERIWRKSE
jgi:hypothetical protein